MAQLPRQRGESNEGEDGWFVRSCGQHALKDLTGLGVHLLLFVSASQINSDFLEGNSGTI
jgi:hypothetical protein